MGTSWDLPGWTAFTLGFVVIQIISGKNPRVCHILIAAFIVRSLFAVIHYYVIPLPDSQFDAASFERLAAQWAAEGFSRVLEKFALGAELYCWILALLYSILGRSPLMAQALNVLFGTLIVWNVYSISRLLWNEKTALHVAMVATVFPTLVLYSAITLREVAVVYPFTLGLLWFIRWLQINRLSTILVSVFAFIVSISFHFGMFIVLILLLFIICIKYLDDFLKVRLVSILKNSIFFIFIIIMIGVVLINLQAFGGFLFKGLNFLNWLSQETKFRAEGRAAYLVWMQPHTLLDLFWQTPIRVVYFLFAPFPWMVQDLKDLFGLLISILNLLLFFQLFRSLPDILANTRARWLLWILVGLLVEFAWLSSNYGISIRHNSKIIPIVLSIVRIPSFKFDKQR